MTLHLPLLNGTTCPSSSQHPSRGIYRKHRWGAIVSIAALLATVFSNPIAHAANVPGPVERQWTIKDLGALDRWSSGGTAISESGMVTGASFVNVGVGLLHAFRYNDGVMTDIDGSPKSYSFGYGINNAGTVVGNYAKPYLDLHPNTYYPFISNGNSLTQLSDREGDARAINNAGQIAGSIRMPSKDDEYLSRAFIYKDGKLNLLGTLGGNSSTAYAINNSGQITGYSVLADNQTHRAFIYSGRDLVDIGTLGGYSSYGYGINDHGHVVGTSLLSNQMHGHAFVYKAGRMEDLGTLGGLNSTAKGINNFGDIVGESDFDSKIFERRAFIYSAGKMTDLNSIPAVKAAGWTLYDASAINNKGQIVGSGTINGLGRAFLLSPVESNGRNCGDRYGHRDDGCDPRTSPYGSR